MRRFIAVIMTMGLVYSLCGAPAGAADEKTCIMGDAATGQTCHLGQYAVLVKGFFAEEGLRVRGIAELDNRTAVSEGRSHRLWVKTDAGLTEADFGYFDTDQLHHMVAGNVDYYIVDGNHFGCWSVMVAPDAPIQSAADLKGKTIEILPFAVEPFLLHGHMWLHHWLKAPGAGCSQRHHTDDHALGGAAESERLCGGGIQDGEVRRGRRGRAPPIADGGQTRRSAARYP